jgi:non-homologous end joining protein Ku
LWRQWSEANIWDKRVEGEERVEVIKGVEDVEVVKGYERVKKGYVTIVISFIVMVIIYSW